jgi:hypothetical protein
MPAPEERRDLLMSSDVSGSPAFKGKKQEF